MSVWKVGDRGDEVVEIKRILAGQGCRNPPFHAHSRDHDGRSLAEEFQRGLVRATDVAGTPTR